MVKRPRSHILEELSSRAFQECIPPEWVVRTPYPDYGIDREVEIFSKGKSTNMFYRVQLKATDQLKRSGGVPCMSFDTNRLNGYLQSPVPVKMVLYDAKAGCLFFEWAHIFFQYASHDEKRKLYTQRTMTIKLPNSLEIASKRGIYQEVRRFFAIVSNCSNQEADAKIKISSTTLDGDNAKLEEHIIHWLASHPKSRNIDLNDSMYDGQLEILDTHVKIQVGIHEQTIDFENGNSLSYDEKVAICKFAIALLMKLSGRSRAALDIITELVSGETILLPAVQRVLFSFPLFAMYANAGKTAEALDLAEIMATKDIFLLPEIMAFAATLDSKELYVEKYRRFIKRRLESNLPAGYKASLCYNLANSLRSDGLHRQAIKYYNKATKLDRKYLTRSYLWREVAGCMFELEKFWWAQAFYEKSISLGEDDPIVVALLGDACLMSGKFELALTHFESYISSTNTPFAEFVLKHMITDFFLASFGDNCQIRVTESQELVSKAIKADECKKESMFLEAIKADPLSGFAWYNYAVYFSRYGSCEKQYLPWLITALLQNGDIEAWINAILSATWGVSDVCDVVLLAMVGEAMRLHGVVFLDKMKRLLLSQHGFEESVVNQFVDIIKNLAQNTRHYFDDSFPARIRYITE